MYTYSTWNTLRHSWPYNLVAIYVGSNAARGTACTRLSHTHRMYNVLLCHCEVYYFVWTWLVLQEVTYCCICNRTYYTNTVYTACTYSLWVWQCSMHLSTMHPDSPRGWGSHWQHLITVAWQLATTQTCSDHKQHNCYDTWGVTTSFGIINDMLIVAQSYCENTFLFLILRTYFTATPFTNANRQLLQVVPWNSHSALILSTLALLVTSETEIYYPATTIISLIHLIPVVPRHQLALRVVPLYWSGRGSCDM